MERKEVTQSLHIMIRQGENGFQLLAPETHEQV